MIFASCFAYHFRHAVGGDRWDAVLAGELANLKESNVPGLRTVGLVELPGVKARVSVHASTIIARSRSQAAGALLRHDDCDVWLSVDEDVFAYGDVTARLIHAARATRGVVSAPCWLRLSKDKPPRINFYVRGDPRTTPCTGVGTLVDGDDFRTGFGLVAIHRSAIERMAEHVPWVEKDERGRYPALFLETVRDGEWIGEDFAFSLLCQQWDVPIHALCDVATEHAGQVCRLRVNDAGGVEALRD